MKSNLLFTTLLFLIIICIIPLSTYAVAGPYNAGFVSGLWYSKVPFFSGQTIRIYAAFQNHSGGDITGVVEFFDNDTSIGEANFSALNDRLVETWIDWTVSYGNHSISAKIVEAQRSEIGKPAEKIEVLTSQSKPETVFADNVPLPPAVTSSAQSAISQVSSAIAESLVTTIDNFVGYSTPPPPVEKVSNTIATVPVTPLISVTQIEKAERSEAPHREQPLSGAGENPAAGTGSGGGGNQSSSITENILHTLNNYKSNLLQTVNAERQVTKSDIKNIDEIHKRVDIDHDGLVSLTDFNVLMINWGKKGANIADYNQDGTVDIIDFNILMIYWSQ